MKNQLKDNRAGEKAWERGGKGGAQEKKNK